MCSLRFPIAVSQCKSVGKKHALRVGAAVKASFTKRAPHNFSRLQPFVTKFVTVSVTKLLQLLARNTLGISAGRSGTGVRPQCIRATGGVPPVIAPPTVKLRKDALPATFVAQQTPHAPALALRLKLQKAAYCEAAEKWDSDSDSDKSEDEEDLKM